jgi:hypothetical protein
VSVDLEQVVLIAKVIWPIAAWVAWVNATVKRTEKDLDHLYFVLRGRDGKRSRTFRGRVKRRYFEMRKAINGKRFSKNSG